MQAGIPTQLGSEKISRLLKQYAVPSIIAMSCSSLYNLVDSIFIGQFAGGYALAGLALTFPLMNLGTAFSSRLPILEYTWGRKTIIWPRRYWAMW